MSIERFIPAESPDAVAPSGPPSHAIAGEGAGRHRRPRARTSVVGVLGELLVTAGVLVLAFIGWQLWLNDLVVGTQAQEEAIAISQEWQKTAGGPVVVAEPERADPGEPVVMGAPGNAEVFGTLIVPRFGADWAWPLAGGVGLEDVLNVRRIGHYDGTQMPGEVGNMVLAAHRTGWGSPFVDANKLQIGDSIFVETEDGWYQYVVRSHEYVTPEGVGVLDPVPQMPGATATDRILTLTTCNPLYSVSERLIVYAVYETWYPRSGGAPAEIAGIVQASAAG